MLADEHRVVAVVLSGHGDSDWRAAWDFDVWAAAIRAVAAGEDSGLPVLVGHSMGSTACPTAATGRADIRGLVRVDSPVGIPHGAPGGAPREMGTYATREEAVGRFRLLPPGPVSCPVVEAHIAEHSVGRRRGWVHKTDPSALQPVLRRVEELTAVSCPVALVRSERGMATAETTAATAARLGRDVVTTVVPDVGRTVRGSAPRLLEP